MHNSSMLVFSELIALGILAIAAFAKGIGPSRIRRKAAPEKLAVDSFLNGIAPAKLIWEHTTCEMPAIRGMLVLRLVLRE